MEPMVQRAQPWASADSGPAPEPRSGRDWAAVVGHELRNPLASALASAHLVAEWTEPGDPRADAARRVIHEIERSAALLDRYILLGRSGRMERQTFDLGAWLHGIVAGVNRQGGIEIRCHGAAGGEVCGDRLLLERALENQLQNARRAGATRWDITLQKTCGAAGDELQLRLVDDGAGVPSHLHDSMFASGVTGGGGSGLGLSIVRDILAAHGGTIEFVPTLLDGACFEWRLPLVSTLSVAEV